MLCYTYISDDLRYFLFTPGQRKNSQGGKKDRRYVQDPIPHYEEPGREHYLANVNERYLSLIQRTGPLYRKPLKNFDENNTPKSVMPRSHKMESNLCLNASTLKQKLSPVIVR